MSEEKLPKHHPLTTSYLKAVNVIIQRHKAGDTCVAEFRDELSWARVEHNHGEIPPERSRL